MLGHREGRPWAGNDDEAPEELLVGPGAGGGTVRIGDTVRRTRDRAPAAMRLVLDHLQAVGFDAAPKILGQDSDGRWVLTFIPGEAALPPQPAWAVTGMLLADVAALLRRYHEAVADMKIPEGVAWPTMSPPEFAGATIGHMDVSMANVICRDGRAVALIDFEEVGPVAPVWDVIRTARHWVPLLDPVDLVGHLGQVVGYQPDRLALFADAYGLDDADRARFVDGVLLNADCTYERMRRGAAAGHRGYLREWTGTPAARNRRGRTWVEANRASLTRALGL